MIDVCCILSLFGLPILGVILLLMVFTATRQGILNWRTTVLGPVLVALLVALVIGLFVLPSYGDQAIYDQTLTWMVLFSSAVGLLAIFDSLRRLDEHRGLENFLPVGATVLFISPVFVILKMHWLVIVPLLVFGGCVLSLYGYHQLHTNSSRGLLYIYGSAFVIIAVPMLAAIMAGAISNLQAPDYIYNNRRGNVSCHAPPLLPDTAMSYNDGEGMLTFISSLSGYTGLATAVYAYNRNKSRKKLQAQGHIPAGLGQGHAVPEPPQIYNAPPGR